MGRFNIAVTAFLIGLWFFPISSQAKELWVYAPVNLLVPQEVTRLMTLMERAQKLGYTHFLIADSKFSRLAEMDKRYFDQVEQVKKRAAELKIKLVPAVCPVGYSNDILSLNPNLAEGLPVRDTLYVVKSGLAQHVSELETNLPLISEPKKWGFIDESLVHEDDALRSSPPHSANVRLSKKLTLKPFRQYHVSVRVKTDGFSTPIEIKALTPQGNSLIFTNLGVKETQDWREHHVTFNSLEHTEVSIYFGAWGPKQGTVWISAPEIEECGAVNLLRRAATPVTIKYNEPSGTGRLLIEGVDFEPWSDPKLGMVPYAGEYEVWHTPPPIRLKKKLPEGTQLRVSYYHPHIVYDGQVCAAANDQAFQDLLDDQIERMTKLFPTADFMMSHDEYRVMGWTEPTIKTLEPFPTPAQVLSHNAKHCSDLLLQRAPKSRVLVWSDMFDPYHNAVDKYYLVNGSLMDASVPREVMIVNWNFGKRQESLRHFADRGHLQIIAGYYDAPPDQIVRWLDTVLAEKVNTVDGVMYTTWRRNYDDLEEFAKLVRGHRWYAEK